MTTLYKATSEGQVPFTDEEMAQWESERTVKISERQQTQYQTDRASEYPSINDYIDGVVKGDQVQIQAYIDACLAVKAKYPKPQ